MLGAVSLCPQGPLPACLVCLFMTRANWTGLTDGPPKLGTGKGEGKGRAREEGVDALSPGQLEGKSVCDLCLCVGGQT